MQAHDPLIKQLPEQYSAIRLCSSPLESAQNADALVIATEWPDYRAISMPEIIASMRKPLILDANRFLSAALEAQTNVIYVTVGKAVEG